MELDHRSATPRAKRLSSHGVKRQSGFLRPDSLGSLRVTYEIPKCSVSLPSSNIATVPKTHGGETKYFSPMTDAKGSKTWSDQPVSGCKFILRLM